MEGVAQKWVNTLDNMVHVGSKVHCSTSTIYRVHLPPQFISGTRGPRVGQIQFGHVQSKSDGVCRNVAVQSELGFSYWLDALEQEFGPFG